MSLRHASIGYSLAVLFRGLFFFFAPMGPAGSAARRWRRQHRPTVFENRDPGNLSTWGHHSGVWKHDGRDNGHQHLGGKMIRCRCQGVRMTTDLSKKASASQGCLMQCGLCILCASAKKTALRDCACEATSWNTLYSPGALRHKISGRPFDTKSQDGNTGTLTHRRNMARGAGIRLCFLRASAQKNAL